MSPARGAGVEIGYSLSSEEHGPAALVHQAQQAEASGFSFALISDHFHPWTTRQGSSGRCSARSARRPARSGSGPV
jgi:alkanesulfonate monooxygenase SsuD/methylene tetrahydromethanopterin reductase-like flavin-dependent oxidoreductase (luciferase family)